MSLKKWENIKFLEKTSKASRSPSQIAFQTLRLMPFKIHVDIQQEETTASLETWEIKIYRSVDVPKVQPWVQLWKCSSSSKNIFFSINLGPCVYAIQTNNPEMFWWFWNRIALTNRKEPKIWQAKYRIICTIFKLSQEPSRIEQWNQYSFWWTEMWGIQICHQIAKTKQIQVFVY